MIQPVAPIQLEVVAILARNVDHIAQSCVDAARAVNLTTMPSSQVIACQALVENLRIYTSMLGATAPVTSAIERIHDLAQVA